MVPAGRGCPVNLPLLWVKIMEHFVPEGTALTYTSPVSISVRGEKGSVVYLLRYQQSCTTRRSEYVKVEESIRQKT